MQALIGIFLSLMPVFADQPTDAIHSIHRAHKSLQQLGQPGCTNCQVFTAAVEDPPWKRCMDELCPNGHGQFQAEVKKAELLYLSEPADLEVYELAGQTFRDEIGEELKASQFILDQLRSEKPLTNTKAVIYANMMVAFRIGGYFVFKDGQVDVAESRKAVPKVAEDKFQLAVQVMNRYASNEPTSELLAGGFGYYVQKYTSAQIHGHIDDALQRILSQKEAVEFLFSTPPGLIWSSLNPSQLELLKSGKYSAEDLEQLKTELRSAYAFTAIKSDPEIMKKLATPSFDPAAVLNTGTKEKLTTRIEDMKKYLADPMGEAPGEIGGYLVAAMASCYSNMQIAKQFLPNSKDVENYKRRMPAYKNDFYSALSKRFSQHSSGVLKTQMDGWKFDMPETYEQYREALKRRLQSVHNLHEQSEATMGVLESNKDMLVAISLFQHVDLLNQPELGEDTKKACETQPPDPLRDAAYTGADSMLIGASGLREDWIGNGKFKHELGHLTSGLFSTGKMSDKSKGWYDSVRTCLMKPKTGDKWVEEDWADFTSYIAGGGPKQCYTMDDVEDEFTVKAPEDEHSSNLYRVLHSYFLKKGEVPQVCTQTLAAKGESFTLTNCDKETAPAAK